MNRVKLTGLRKINDESPKTQNAEITFYTELNINMYLGSLVSA